jgi:hypothetical protein
MGSACPPEVPPPRVPGFWLPDPSLPSARERARTARSFPPRLPGSEEHGPSHELRPPYRVSDRSLRPTRRRIGSSLGVLHPDDDFRGQVRFTRVCLTRHLPASGFRPSRRLAPWRAVPARRPTAAHGVHPSGHVPPTSRTRFRAVAPMPFPALPAFSSEDEKVGSSAATPGLSSGRRAGPSGRSCPPSDPRPSWVSSPLRSSRPAAMVPASRNLPSCAFTPKATEVTDDAGAPGSRSTARSGELSRARRLP